MNADEYQRLCSTIVEQSGDAIIVADHGGGITLWNASAERLFGFTATEAVGQTLDLIIPERLRTRHWDGYHKTMATDETRYGTDLLAVPAVRKDGTRLSIEFTIVLLRDTAGAPAGAAAVLRDVTAKWQLERTLRQEIAELKAMLAAQASPVP